MTTNIKNEVFENLTGNEIIFRNFIGAPDAYNTTGKRQFSIALNEERAEDLKRKGWNVKLWTSRDGDLSTPFITVEVKYGKYPPKCYLISGRENSNGSIDILAKTLLDEDTIGQLDAAEIAKCDIIISPYSWEMNGSRGIKAYAKAIYATTIMDPLELKYSDFGSDLNDENLDEYVPFN